MEVESAMREIPRLKPDDPKFNLQKYVGTEFSMRGTTTPQNRGRFKKGYSFSAEPTDQQYAIWKYIWQTSNSHETMSQALYFLEKNALHLDPVFLFSELQTWLKRIDNWAHSDMLTHHFAALHEAYPKMVYPVLQKWNTSSNPWERRQSVLSLLDYARFRKRYPPFSKILALLKPLLSDKDIFVQKAIGWCLRETHFVYPEKTEDWIFKNAMHLSSIAFSSATEKYAPSKKNRLKTLRKKHRSAARTSL